MRGRVILWRIVLLSLLCYSAFSFFSEADLLDKTACEADSLLQELQLLRQENLLLRHNLEQRNKSQLQDMARDRLGLVLPGEKLFYFTEHREG